MPPMRPVAQNAVNAGWALVRPDGRLAAPNARCERFDRGAGDVRGARKRCRGSASVVAVRDPAVEWRSRKVQMLLPITAGLRPKKPPAKEPRRKSRCRVEEGKLGRDVLQCGQRGHSDGARHRQGFAQSLLAPRSGERAVRKVSPHVSRRELETASPAASRQSPTTCSTGRVNRQSILHQHQTRCSKKIIGSRYRQTMRAPRRLLISPPADSVVSRRS
jgi:hypothetical protein